MTAPAPAAVLLISPEPWDAHPVSKHHYARSLARLGKPVLFLEPPDTSLHSFSLKQVPEEPGLLLVQGPKLAPGLRFFPTRWRNKLERSWLRRLEHLSGYAIDAVWLFENSRFYDLGFAEGCLKVYHQVDLNQIFHPRRAALSADICFCTTELIRRKLALHNPRVFKLHHGLAPVYSPLTLDVTQHERLDLPGVHAAYIGNLDMAYLDQNLLVDVIRGHPDVHFHLVGGYKPDSMLRELLASCRHVHWWGKVPSSLILVILDRVDLLMVCYQAQHHDDQASPHKFMEYLASGRTIVATFTAEYQNHSQLLAMSAPGGNEGYLPLFQNVLANLDDWNSAPRIAARQAFAADHSYSRQLQRIENYLKVCNLPALGPDQIP